MVLVYVESIFCNDVNLLGHPQSANKFSSDMENKRIVKETVIERLNNADRVILFDTNNSE